MLLQTFSKKSQQQYTLMAFNLICIGVLLQHSKQRRLIIQNVMNVSDNLDQRILHFNKTKVYKRQRPNKQVCTFLFRRKDFAAGAWLIMPPIGKGSGVQLLQWFFCNPKWDDWHLAFEKQTFISLALSKNMDWGFKFISKAAWWPPWVNHFQGSLEIFELKSGVTDLVALLVIVFQREKIFLPWWVLEAFL